MASCPQVGWGYWGSNQGPFDKEFIHHTILPPQLQGLASVTLRETIIDVLKRYLGTFQFVFPSINQYPVLGCVLHYCSLLLNSIVCPVCFSVSALKSATHFFQRVTLSCVVQNSLKRSETYIAFRSIVRNHTVSRPLERNRTLSGSPLFYCQYGTCKEFKHCSISIQLLASIMDS